MKKDTSEILKMAFGLSELLGKQFPDLRFKVLPGLLFVVGKEESTSACVVSDQYQITITENRIALNVTSINAIEASGIFDGTTEEVLTDMPKFGYSFVLDKPEQCVFELQDPQAINRIIEVISENIGAGK